MAFECNMKSIGIVGNKRGFLQNDARLAIGAGFGGSFH